MPVTKLYFGRLTMLIKMNECLVSKQICNIKLKLANPKIYISSFQGQKFKLTKKYHISLWSHPEM